MSIDKVVTTSMDYTRLFCGSEKLAQFEPETHVPPEIEEYVEHLKPDPRCSYVHTIAMSDGDSYGSNMNGDIFRAGELTGIQSAGEASKNPSPQTNKPVPRFKTFETAKFFRHHANSKLDPAYGDIPVAAWNSPMKRVEVIARIFKSNAPELGIKGAPDVVAKLEKRGYLVVSMGCRIAYEKCSSCGNENEFISQRCPCLKDRMNEIMPDGQKVAAINFQPRFFDLSDVWIPADPIAYSLKKVASAQMKTSSLVSNTPNWESKIAAITKHVDTVSKVTKHTCNLCKTVKEAEPALISELAKTAGDMNTLASTCSGMGIVLAPTEFILATKVSNSYLDNLSVDNFSPALYYLLKKNLGERIGYTADCPTSGWHPSKIASLGFEDLASYYSYYREVLKNIDRTSFEKTANRNPWLRELATNHDSVLNAQFHLAYAGIMET